MYAGAACLSLGAMKRPGEQEHVLYYLKIASERLKESKPVRNVDIGLAPVVQSLRAPRYLTDDWLGAVRSDKYNSSV